MKPPKRINSIQPSHEALKFLVSKIHPARNTDAENQLLLVFSARMEAYALPVPSAGRRSHPCEELLKILQFRFWRINDY